MGLGKCYKKYNRSVSSVNKDDEAEISDIKKQISKLTKDEKGARESKTEAKPVKPMKMIKQMINNPNFNMQLMVILLTLTSDNIQMDRRIDGMTTTIDKVRNITELVNNGMQSMKMVSEVPKNIRRMLE